MILSDNDISRRLHYGNLDIEGMESESEQIQPASVDLRLGYEFAQYDTEEAPISPSDDSVRWAMNRCVCPSDESFVLEPGDFVLGTTIERVSVPDDLLAKVQGRSSLGRLGVGVHVTAGIVDPGFEGQITLELTNVSDVPIELEPEMRVCQLTFHELTSEASEPYGEERGSKYQGQSGAVPSRIDEDFQ